MPICKEDVNTSRNPEAADGADMTHRLALRPREAAKALGIGQRKLWELTSRGEIPHIRVGKAVLYPVAALEAWLADQTRGAQR